MSTVKSDRLNLYNWYRVAHFNYYWAKDDFRVTGPSQLPFDPEPDGEDSTDPEEDYDSGGEQRERG
jgi:hypothetical protein